MRVFVISLFVWFLVSGCLKSKDDEPRYFLTKIISSDTLVKKYIYDKRKRAVIYKTLINNNTVKEVEKFFNRSGVLVKIEYRDKVKGITDTLKVEHNEHDLVDRTVLVKKTLKISSTYEYNNKGQISSVLKVIDDGDTRSVLEEYMFDSSGNISRVIYKEGATRRTINFVYSTYNNPLARLFDFSDILTYNMMLVPEKIRHDNLGDIEEINIKYELNDNGLISKSTHKAGGRVIKTEQFVYNEL